MYKSLTVRVLIVWSLLNPYVYTMPPKTKMEEIEEKAIHRLSLSTPLKIPIQDYLKTL